MNPLDTLADVMFGGTPRTSTELDRLFSFRRGFTAGFVAGACSAVVIAAYVVAVLG